MRRFRNLLLRVCATLCEEVQFCPEKTAHFGGGVEAQVWLRFLALRGRSLRRRVFAPPSFLIHWECSILPQPVNASAVAFALSKKPAPEALTADDHGCRIHRGDHTE